ncbi:YibE/F family protein [Desulfocicer niacini]
MHIKKYGSIILLLLLMAAMAAMAAGYGFWTDNNNSSPDAREVKARVLTVDNSDVRSAGLSHIGFQALEIKILEGRFKGETVSAFNNLVGQTDIENLFKKDDVIIAAVIMKDDAIEQVKAVDLFRQNTLLFLFCFFVVALLLYAGVIGVKALISFMFTVFILWEFLIQQILNGHPPLVITTCTIILLSAVIIFLVAGINAKGITAFIGTISELFVTLSVTLYFGWNDPVLCQCLDFQRLL